MGTWGKGPFDNDAASDFLGELSECASVLEAVEAALARVIDSKPDEYLDVDDGQVCLAACELVAEAFGAGQLPAKRAKLIAPLAADRSLVRRALQALPRVADRKHSELAEVWNADSEPFDGLYERLIAVCDAGARVPVIDLRRLLSEPGRPPMPKVQLLAQPFKTEPFDVTRIASSPGLAPSARGKAWMLLSNGVLNVYDQLTADDLTALGDRGVSMVQFGRRFRSSEATLQIVDRILEKNPTATLRVTLNGFGAFDDLSMLTQLANLRGVVIDGGAPFLTEDAPSVLARFPNLTRVVVNGREARRT